MDKKFISKEINDANIIHHLAGVTDVSYVKKDSNNERDEKIKKIAVEGTSNILEGIPNDCKIIFPSTHVIFEGLKAIGVEYWQDNKVKIVKCNKVPKKCGEY